MTKKREKEKDTKEEVIDKAVESTKSETKKVEKKVEKKEEKPSSKSIKILSNLGNASDKDLRSVIQEGKPGFRLAYGELTKRGNERQVKAQKASEK